MTDDSGSETKRKRISLPKQAAQSGIVAELLMLLETVTADGKISDEEVAELNTWLYDNVVSDLPGIDFLRTTVTQILADGVVTREEKTALYRAVERILPPEARRQAKERRSAVEALEKEYARSEKSATQTAEREARASKRPIASANFMVAGVLHEDRAEVIERYASEGDTVFLVREPENAYDSNAIRVRLQNGRDIGFVPREYAAGLAPALDSGSKQHAYLTKILTGRRAPIPVVQANLYRSDAPVSGALLRDEIPEPAGRRISTEPGRGVPKRASAQAESGEERFGCVGCLFGALVVGGVILLLALAKGF